MKSILLFSRDPGGANTIVPLIGELNKAYDVILYGKDRALQVYEKSNLQFHDIMGQLDEITQESIDHFIDEINPDLLITATSADDYTEKYIWKSCNEKKIPSYAILDQWVNYGVRFSKYSVSELDEYNLNKSHDYLPDKILVMDEYAKEQVVKENIAKEKVIVTGQPYFEYFKKTIDQISEEEKKNFTEKLEYSSDEMLVVFASEPITKVYGEEYGKNYWGYDEISIGNELIQTLGKLSNRLSKKVKLVIKPHPKEDLEKWLTLKDRYNYDHLKIVIDQKLDTKLYIKFADLVCGMSSMFLIESALYEQKILSIQIGLKRDNPLVLEKMGVLKTIRTNDELEQNLTLALKGNLNNCSINLKKNAVNNILGVIKNN